MHHHKKTLLSSLWVTKCYKTSDARIGSDQIWKIMIFTIFRTIFGDLRPVSDLDPNWEQCATQRPVEGGGEALRGSKRNHKNLSNSSPNSLNALKTLYKQLWTIFKKQKFPIFKIFSRIFGDLVSPTLASEVEPALEGIFSRKLSEFCWRNMFSRV